MTREEITIQKIIDESLTYGSASGLVAPLGINENEKIEYVDYSKINHMLICGTTGSGKTTFVRTLVAFLMATIKSDRVKFCLFDSRKTDYIDFQRSPNLIVPVITDSRKCVGMLSWVLSEAKTRINNRSDENFESKYPEIFIILDDYAEITKEPNTQEILCELLKIAHRVKIHVVIVTSIALERIISTEIKVHITHRIAFFLPEKINSRIVIDQNGAENLEMPGQFIAKFYNKANTYYSIELPNAEIRKNINSLVDEMKTFDNDIIIQIDRLACGDTVGSNYESDYDEMLPKAIETVIEAQSASTTLLQRKLKLGYARASKIIDELEERGIIGPYEGAMPRKVLISRQQWYEMNILTQGRVDTAYTEDAELGVEVDVITNADENICPDTPKESLLQRIKKGFLNK